MGNSKSAMSERTILVTRNSLLSQECAEVRCQLVHTVQRGNHPNISIRPNDHDRAGMRVDAILCETPSSEATLQVGIVHKHPMKQVSPLRSRQDEA